MAARVTQQVVTVGFTKTPEARASAAAYEVLNAGAPEARVTAAVFEVIRSVAETAGGGSSQTVTFVIMS
jgi:hypothetical protein